MPDVGRALRDSNLAFASEGDGATDVANIGRAVEPMLRELEERAAEDLHIRAATEALRRREPALAVRSGFRAGASHRIPVSIGPRQEGLIVATEATLPKPSPMPPAIASPSSCPSRNPSRGRSWERSSCPCSVPAGRSYSRCACPRMRKPQARIAVLHRGRILQTAILRGPVLPAAEPERRDAAAGLGVEDLNGADRDVPEADLRPGFVSLDDRQRFDAAIILNEDRRGRHGGTVVAGSKAARFEFDFVSKAVASLSRELDRASATTRSSASWTRETHRLPAAACDRRQRPLHRYRPEDERALGPRHLERLQVLSANPDTMLPVEPIYDLPPPTPDETPTLCENASVALETGACEPRYHVPTPEDFLPVICPAGFWGISKVIERQATDGEQTGAAFEVRAVGDQRRDPLRPLAPVLPAASDRINEVNKDELEALHRRSLAAHRLAGHARPALARLGRRRPSRRPPVLVVLSHTELAARTARRWRSRRPAAPNGDPWPASGRTMSTRRAPSRPDRAAARLHDGGAAHELPVVYRPICGHGRVGRRRHRSPLSWAAMRAGRPRRCSTS